ncbi:MAG: M81 family metallopeptidase [Alphaproteobacteria bacterium]|jgi:microcystin degradation protein MlrC|nr:M81 family metallopeptidase [Alphaproteobacteria bacterium]
MARIAHGGFMHETNCFVPMRTDYEYYARGGESPPLARGEEIYQRLTGSSYGTSGFLDEMRDRHELVPLIWGAGGAGGYVTDDAFERIVGELVGGLSRAMPVDAVYLDLHGAMCSESFEDAEGEVLRRVRATVGPDLPLVISLDYHANVTERIAALVDGMAIYLTYPHIDRQHTGGRAARILDRVLTEGRPTHRTFRKAPFLLPLNFQCTLVDPTKAIVDATVEGEGGDILNLSYAAGFPPSDLFECGPAVICHGYDGAVVEAAADGIFAMVTGAEADFAEELLTPDEAVTQAMELSKSAKLPVVIADTQDNPGCGGTGDTTGLLEAFVRHDAQGVAMCVMCDAQAAAAAHAAGEGGEITVDLGGKHDIPGDKPFAGTFTVTRLGDGQFTTTGKSIPGREVNLGPTALLTIGGIGVVTASRRMQAFDQDIFRHVGIEPKEQKILGLKSTCHFRADFDPIAEKTLIVLAPGAHIVDSSQYPFKYLRPGVRLAPMGPEHEPAT